MKSSMPYTQIARVLVLPLVLAAISCTKSHHVSEPVVSIHANAGPHGSISPSGEVVVGKGADQAFQIKPASGYEIATVNVDGVVQGDISSYTFSKASADHAIYAVFRPATPNLVPNPSVETEDSTDSTKPKDWSCGSYNPDGKLVATFSYLNTGHTGGHSLKAEITSMGSGGGSSSWSFTKVPVIAGAVYELSDWYQSNTNSDIGFIVETTTGETYPWLATLTPSATWTQFKRQFTAPADAVKLTVTHSISGVGWLVTDDFSLKTYTPSGFKRPLVSLTFDDGQADTFQYGAPVLESNGVRGTFYVLTGPASNQDPYYMSKENVQALSAKGHEVGSHSVTHPVFTTLTATQMEKELLDSKTTLQSWLPKAAIDNFAVPFNMYNNTFMSEVQKYYGSNRTVNGGFNSMDTYASYLLMGQEVHDDTTPNQIAQWLDYAKATNTWLVLILHGVNPAVDLNDQDAWLYTVTPTQLDAIVKAIADRSLPVVTMAEALTEVRQQITPKQLDAVYTIQASAGANGTISPSGNEQLFSGSTRTFVISADHGYAIDSVLVDGVSKGALASYTFTDVKADHTISATFKTAPKFTIEASAEANGTITPSGSVEVIQGDDQTFTIKPAAGYKVDAVSVDGVDQGAIATYTFSKVTAAHTISATFKASGAISIGKTAVASSLESDATPASNAVDGDTTTRWASAWSDPQWIYVDLGTTQTITKIILYWEASYGTAYQIQVSDDATNWTDIYSTTSGSGGTETIDGFGSANGRYVRLYGTQRVTLGGAQYGYSLYEFEVYGN